jgi:ubiquinone/menaquinone biosynthesis C-methylase UbiE
MRTTPEPSEKESDYYRSAVFLREKHRRTHVASGRLFQAWALDLAPFTASSVVLDTGCGWGRFTWHLVDAGTVAAANIVCADLSPTMLRLVHEEAQTRRSVVKTCCCDTERLPFRAAAFDVVMANHMLYHVTNIRHGLRELARVLAPGGYLLATTNSERVAVPIIELHYQALAAAGVAFEPEGRSAFSMESGKPLMQEVFRDVAAHYFEDMTEYATAEEFVQLYMTTGRYRNFIARADVPQATKDRALDAYRRLTQDIIDREGKLSVPTLMGAFVCGGAWARS